MSQLRTHEVPAEIDPSDWTLQVTGAVSNPLRIDQEELLEFPVGTVVDDFECIEGGSQRIFRGGGYASVPS